MDSPYNAETVYTATVTLVSLPGYKFPMDGSTVALNTDATNSGGTVNGGTTGNEGDISGNTLSFTVTFPATIATDITTAGVTGFTTPVTGGIPITLGTLAPNIAEQYTVTDLTWFPSDISYLGAQIYTATVTLTSLLGYKFPVGGMGLAPADGGGTASEGITGEPDASGNTLSYTVTFPETAATDITTVGVTGFIAPATGGTPQTFEALAPDTVEQYTVTDLTWDPTDSPYLGETIYTATITLTSEPGYKFPLGGIGAPTADGGTVNSGGTTGSEGDISGNTLSFTVTFPATTPVTIAGTEITGVTPPVTGAIPVTAATDTDEYTTEVTWNGDPTTFDASTPYTATITLTPKAGYTLTGVTENQFTVAGVTGIATNAADSGIVTAVFPATAAPVMTGSVAISGTEKFGQVLTATPSLTYTPTTSSDVPTYQWKRGGTNIGTNSGTYTLVEIDIGTTITVTVTADGVNATGEVTSSPTGTIALADGPSAPSAPTEASKTATSITLTANALNEFSIDSGSTWQDSEVFTSLTPLTSYTFTARVKETSTTNASVASVASASITTDAPVMTGSVAISGTEKFGQVLTATPSLTYTPATSSDVPTYQWKRNGSAIGSATAGTYTLVLADITNTITVTVTADGTNATGNVTSSATGSISKADGPSAPSAPTLASKTTTSITLAAMSGNEFSIDSGSTWQDSEVFTSLTPLTSYTFTARVKETSTTNASVASVASASITTDESGITVGGGGTYPTLGEALTAVNEGNLTGDVVLQIISSIIETQTVELFENDHNGTANYTSVNIFPVYPNLTISGDIVGDLIRFNGTTNVHIDGRVNQSGPDSLHIENTSTEPDAVTLHYIGAANTDVLHCVVVGDIVVDNVRTVGTTGAYYPTLLDAFFDINNGILTGAIVLQIIDNTSEYATAELFESGYGGSSGYTSITIYPTLPNLSITGDLSMAYDVFSDLIKFNGSQNVHIDGRVNFSGPDSLHIENTSTEPDAVTLHYIGAINTDVLYSNVIGGIITE